MSDIQIKDGAGTGRRAKVDVDNRLAVTAVADGRVHFSNHVKQEAYTITLSQTPTGAGDVFLYIKNSNQSADLNIWMFGVRVAAAESIKLWLGGTGTPVGGTAVVPVNRTANSGHVAQGTFLVGNDITGLTAATANPGNQIFFPADNASHPWECPCGIIIPPNSIFYVTATTGAIAINMDVLMEYHAAEHAG